MQTEVIVAGFGGQGVLFTGQLLSYAAMDEGKDVTWIPSYGPEMRGGTANCTVIIADEEIGSPLVRNPRAVIAMNLPSLDKYEPVVLQGGLLVINSSMVNRQVNRKDIRNVALPANDLAEELGDKKLTNMVLLGALLGNLDVIPMDALKKALKEHLPERHHKLLPLNYQALEKGASFKA
ncbi:MAG: 2-oxoacid:acceptor oxidoreductase family protein [Anaerolineaceae bacterium]|nr:2-oxoacid:acceptor oxidoreductase family protein [Anaerolineaceae bacterium]MBN2678316.1 2-oxoacid:acceptor oxidoreductase family protein [Anaerolineaceae bacterium]